MDPKQLGQFLTQPSTADVLETPYHRGGILPLDWYPGDRAKFNLSSGITGALADALTAPARAYRGEIPEDQMVPEAFNFAGNLTLGGLLSPKPANTVGIFGGRLAKTADQEALARAEQMAQSGAPREQIWNETGWFQGPDKQWRFEIPDQHSMMAVDPEIGAGVVAGNIHHPKLIEAYPHLKDVLYTTDKEFIGPVEGLHFTGKTSQGERVTGIGINPLSKDQRSTMLHEIQHSIQEKEGFSPGSGRDRSQIEAQQLADMLSNDAAPLKAQADKWSAVYDETKPLYEASHLDRLEGLVRDNLKPRQVFRMGDYDYRVTEGMGKMPSKAGLKRDDWLKEAAMRMRDKYINELKDRGTYDEVMRLREQFKTPRERKNAIARLERKRSKFSEGSREYMKVKERIQDLESLDPFAAYQKSAGEVEARAVQARRDMTREQLKERPPWKDYDQPENSLVIAPALARELMKTTKLY